MSIAWVFSNSGGGDFCLSLEGFFGGMYLLSFYFVFGIGDSVMNGW